MGKFKGNSGYYDSLLHFPDLILFSETAEGVINSWSKGAEKFFALDAKSILGKTPSSLFSPETIAQFSVVKNQLSNPHSEENLPEKFNTQYKNHNVTFSLSSIKDNSGKVLGFLTLAEEILDENEREESDLQKSLKEISDYKYALDESSIVAITDQKGIINHVNENFCKISKFSAEELIGQDHRIINSSFHPKEFIRNIWVTIANGKIWKGELKNKAKDGTYYWVDTTIVPFLNERGKPYQYVAIRSDITARKQAEEEIKDLNEKLEARVAQRTIDLETLNEELESFCYSISHDLRAPLRAINGYSFIVKKNLQEIFGNELNAEDRENIEKIISNTKRMGHLIDDLLAFSRLGRQEIVKSPFEMSVIVNQILSELQKESANGKTKINMKIQHNAPSDLNMMRQVWVNLISNALKYSAPKEEILIEIGSIEGPDEVIFYIKDNGVGFNMDYAGKLFGVFHRLHSDKEFEGVGVGLAVVKKIIQKHKGKVWAEAKENEGAVFYFTLPK